jgi:hypothetical protein
MIMNQNSVHNKSVNFYDLVKKLFCQQSSNYTWHLKNPKVLMLTTSKPYILHL